MRGFTLRVSLVALLLVATATLAALPTFSSSGRAELDRSTADAPDNKGRNNKSVQSRNATAPLSYRSPGALHKFIVPSDATHIEEALVSSSNRKRVKRYGSYTLVEADGEALARLDRGAFERVELRDDMNLILLKRGQIDTTSTAPPVAGDLSQRAGFSRSLHLVQLFGPPKTAALRALKSTGAKIVSYIPNNAYLIWAAPEAIERVRALTASGNILQWDGPFQPVYKLDRHFKLDSVEQVPVSVELLDTPDAARTIAQIKSVARTVLMPEFEAAGNIHIKVLVESFRLAEIARIPDVLNIEPWAKIKLADERGSQIVAGVLSEETVNSIKVSRPTRPGFMAFLNSIGFNSNFDFAVDVADTGFDKGSEDFRQVHPDFLDSTGASRIAYLHDFSSDFLLHQDNPNILANHDTFGHGTINASIIGGSNTTNSSAFTDSLGFQYGLGVAPFVRIGISKVFDDQGLFASGLDFRQYIKAAYRNGARISSNSWGQCDTFTGFCNLYNADARAYDAIVRDADPDEAGNQAMTIVFAAGNDGNNLPASITMPGTAKNVITVGASESFRATDASGQPLVDGCGAGGSLADNALDVVSFSARGPLQDGRAKPDLVAPGTHIVGAAPQDQFYAVKSIDDILVCDRYFPSGQSLYTWSTGTSQAAPFVSGGAALAFQWLRSRDGEAPSPALVKAFILNSTSYISGNNGGDNLPGTKQGWGRLNLSRMFETTERIIYDESPARTFTESGGAPFEITGVVSDPSKEFRIMLVWTEPPGSSTTNATYVNQLNLEVTVGGVVYNANRFAGQYSTTGGQKDFLNNVQGVRLPAGTVGPFVIRVRPTIIAGAASGDASLLNQDFALVVTNGREMAVPVLTLNAVEEITQGVTVLHTNGAADAFLIPGERARVSVTLNNISQTVPANITQAGLTIIANNGTNGQFGPSTFSTIAPGASSTNAVPFEIQVPSDLICGSTATLELQLETAEGRIKLPLRLRVGRPASTSVLVNDDVDAGRVKWKLKKGFSISTITGNSGSRSYHAVDPGKEDANEQLSTLTMKKKINIPANAGRVRLTFLHIFNFEPGFDGGVIEISTDNGATWEDLGARAITGGYDGKVTEATFNPLGNRLAWTARGKAGIFSPVVINLDEFAGKRVQFRFLAGFDTATGVREGYAGWFIDDIRITTELFDCR